MSFAVMNDKIAATLHEMRKLKTFLLKSGWREAYLLSPFSQSMSILECSARAIKQEKEIKEI